jgi:hypothetical protein
MTEPHIWRDEVFSDGTPEPAPPVALPATAEEAKKQFDAIYAPGSTFNWNAPGASDLVLGLARKSAGAPSDTASPGGGSGRPSELSPPVTTEAELPPVELKPEDLPTFTLPQYVAADDPAMQELREVAALAEVPPSIVQNAITRALALVTTTDAPTDDNAIDTMGERAIAQAQARFGGRYEKMFDDAQQALTILGTAHPDLQDILNDPRVQNDVSVFEALAALGAKARTYYVRRYGTGGSQVVRW